MGEAADKQIIMVLLDWEKAFDKITREELWSALDRLNRPPGIEHDVILYADDTICILSLIHI